jgi:hypothetical protein
MRQDQVSALAQYILDLSYGLEHTHRAEDRPVYEDYLADAAVLLALLVSDAKSQAVAEAVKGHEHLQGWSWLQDPVCQKSAESWGRFKALL